ncbi:MAG: hypothetical protein EBX35_01550 [Planctomycetia bacterium]|nr:hypothetical protein [Planctomycetia bacterium]
MAVCIHQIYYDDAQRAALDPAFLPYDNRENPRPEWREYHVFRTEWLAGRCRAGDVTGFLSWKFGAKTGIAGRAFVEFVEGHPGHDVYFVNPSRVEPRPFTGIWQQAEVHHPGIIGLAQRIFDQVGVAVDLATLEQPREQVLFCNYWAGTRRFWDEYMTFCEPVHRQILSGLDAADRALVWSRADREIDASYVPFIMERLFSTFLALRPDLRSRGLDLERQLRANRPPWWRRLVRRRRAA